MRCARIPATDGAQDALARSKMSDQDRHFRIQDKSYAGTNVANVMSAPGSSPLTRVQASEVLILPWHTIAMPDLVPKLRFLLQKLRDLIQTTVEILSQLRTVPRRRVRWVALETT